MALLLQQGIRLNAESGKKDEVLPGEVVKCFHVDRDRDSAFGFPLSQYNLNYVLEKKPDEKDLKLKSTLLKAIDPKSLPSSIDLRPQFGDILDQGTLGSCVSHSAAYQLRYLLRKMTGKYRDFSRLFIYYNGRVVSKFPLNRDTGLAMRDGFRSISTFGAADEALWPYAASQFSVRAPDSVYAAGADKKSIMYFAVSQELNEMKKCLKDGFPISFGLTLYESFMSAPVAATGKIPVPNQAREKRVGGHAMTIVGYQDATQSFIVANQWNKAWGDKGYGYFPYALLLDTKLCGDLWTARAFSTQVKTIQPSSTTETPALPPAPQEPDEDIIPAWAPQIHYMEGDKVIYLGIEFTCLVPHKSLSIWSPPMVPPLWEKCSSA